MVSTEGGAEGAAGVGGGGVILVQGAEVGMDGGGGVGVVVVVIGTFDTDTSPVVLILTK